MGLPTNCVGCGARLHTAGREVCLTCDPSWPPVVYARNQDAGTLNACWVVCSEGDDGAIMFLPAEGEKL